MVGLHFLGFLGMVCVCPVPLDVLKRLAAAAQDFDFFDLRLSFNEVDGHGPSNDGKASGMSKCFAHFSFQCDAICKSCPIWHFLNIFMNCWRGLVYNLIGKILAMRWVRSNWCRFASRTSIRSSFPGPDWNPTGRLQGFLGEVDHKFQEAAIVMYIL